MEAQEVANQLSVRLSPVPVTESAPGKVRVLTEEGEVWAGNALAFPYQPERGDLVLAIGQQGKWFVIGVLKAKGAMHFQFPADAVFSAPRGEITLKAAKGLELHSPNVRLRAGKLELIARSVIEKADTAWRWIKGLMQVRAGRERTDIDEISQTTAKRFLVKAKEDVKLDGDKIYLG